MDDPPVTNTLPLYPNITSSIGGGAPVFWVAVDRWEAKNEEEWGGEEGEKAGREGVVVCVFLFHSVYPQSTPAIEWLGVATRVLPPLASFSYIFFICLVDLQSPALGRGASADQRPNKGAIGAFPGYWQTRCNLVHSAKKDATNRK